MIFLNLLHLLQLEEYKSAQKISYTKDLEVLKEQERDIEKEIKNRENNINCLKHFRGRCAEIVSFHQMHD